MPDDRPPTDPTDPQLAALARLAAAQEQYRVLAHVVSGGEELRARIRLMAAARDLPAAAIAARLGRLTEACRDMIAGCLGCKGKGGIEVFVVDPTNRRRGMARWESCPACGPIRAAIAAGLEPPAGGDWGEGGETPCDTT